MRSSVSYILSHAPGESVMSHPDYAQHAQHHACLLVLVKGIGSVLKNFNKHWECIQSVNNIKVTDSSGQVRDIWVRYVRDYPVENNDWGDFQTHRRLLGLLTLSKFSNQIELNEVCRVHESLKVKYSNTLYDSRAFMFGPGSNLKKPEQEPETYSVYEEDKAKEKSSLSDNISLPSEPPDSVSSCDSIPHSTSSTYSVQEENFTTPSNFKTHALFYGENDQVKDLAQHVEELINSLFWVVESKRLERSREKLEKVSLLLAPFEKRDFVGLDMESRNNKKRCMGRVTKNLADLTLQAGLVPESLSLYHSAAEILKSVNDWLWLAAAKEVSYILSHAPGESVMSHPDYAQHAQHHACLLVLVKGIGGVLKNFNKHWECIQSVNNIKVTDSSGQVRDIWVRYVRDYPVENNDWGDFQTHRRLLGLLTLSKFSNQIELNEVCRVHESLKVKYSNTLYDSRAFMFGPGSNLKKPEQEPETYSVYEEDKAKEKSSLSDNISLPSEPPDSVSSCDSIPHSTSSTYSVQEENFTTPSNFKTHALFYGENDQVKDLAQHVEELINSLFWVVESKRLERSREKLEKVSLLLAPFEKRDFVGLDMESRNNKKRCMGRVTKNLADLTLQAGLVPESLSLYHSAAEILKSVNDWLWLAAAKEGHCATSAILQYPNLRNSTPLQRNASLQESSPNKTKTLSLYQPSSEPYRKAKINFSKTSSLINPNEPSSSESDETSSRQSKTDNGTTESSSDNEYKSQISYLSPDLPSIPRQPSAIHTHLLSGEEIAEKYRKAIIHYSKYQNAGIIETEACFKAARIAVEQNNSLHASSFLQNVIFINLTLSEQEKIQRFDTLAELYKEIGFLRKAAFCQRLAATRQVSANNPNPDWPRCYHLMLHSFPGHKLSLDPNYAVQHQVGWPALQIQLLHEVVVAARRRGHPALATRHMTFLLQTMWPHLSAQEHRDLAIQLQALSAQCEGGPVPLVLETGEVIPPANLTHVPSCLYFNPRPLPPTRTPHLIKSKSNQGPFIFTPIHFGSLERKSKKDEGKMEYLWVEDDICEVQMKLTNPLPFELKVSNMRLLTSGVVFESIPETIILLPDSPTTVNLHGTPKEVGELQILGYSTHTLGVKSNCRLKNMPLPHKFPAAFSIEVIPSLPIITIETTLSLSGSVNLMNTESSGNITNISLYNGESTECTIKITNTSNVAIEYFELLIQSNMDNQLQGKVFQWSNENIQSQLPIKPNDVAVITMKLYGEADFLDLGGVGENLFPNSLTSNYPSRVGSPVPNAQTSLPQSSNPQNSLSSGLMVNRTSGSFRSANSQTTSWSAPISIMPPSRGRQIETQIILRYSGGLGKDMHCRQSTLQMNLELLPSVSITHWDVLPAEIPSQLYLVLDITNLTNEEMDFEYAPTKHILIESKESCRVPVPLDRCPFNSTPVKIEDDSIEPKSISTGTSTNSLEVMCSEHLTKNVDLKWHLLQPNISGRASVKGITLSQTMMDIVRMSPLNWEVSLNKQCIKPQEEYSCMAGECLFLGVAVSNHLKRPLHKLCLSVQFYQDYNNGVRNYKLDNRVATAGNNKVVLSTLLESAKAYHECTVVFLTPGEYKIDIQCSTTEPILDETPVIKDSPSVQSCAEEVSHTWRFIPPVAISVTD